VHEQSWARAITAALILVSLAGCNDPEAVASDWNWGQKEIANYLVQDAMGTSIGELTVNVEFAGQELRVRSHVKLQPEFQDRPGGPARNYTGSYTFDAKTGELISMITLASPDEVAAFHDDQLYFPAGIHKFVPRAGAMQAANLRGNADSQWALVGPQWFVRWNLNESPASEASGNWGDAGATMRTDAGGWNVTMFGPCESDCNLGFEQEKREIDRWTLTGDWKFLLPKQATVFLSESALMTIRLVSRFAEGVWSPMVNMPAKSGPVMGGPCSLPPCDANPVGNHSFQRGADALHDSLQWRIWTTRNPGWYPAAYVLVPEFSSAVAGQALPSAPHWTFFISSPNEATRFDLDDVGGQLVVQQAASDLDYQSSGGRPQYPISMANADESMSSILLAVGSDFSAIESIHYAVQDAVHFPSLRTQHVISIVFNDGPVKFLSFSALDGTPLLERKA
jgi:hypothetical protein